MGSVYDYYYENYLMLYSLYGRGRPRITREQYEALDRELLLLVKETPNESMLEYSSSTRIADIEYMLLDDIAESLLESGVEEPRQVTGKVKKEELEGDLDDDSTRAPAPLDEDDAAKRESSGDTDTVAFHRPLKDDDGPAMETIAGADAVVVTDKQPGKGAQRVHRPKDRGRDGGQ